jgi:hypothetical protein
MTDFVPTTSDDLVIDENPAALGGDPEAPAADRWEQVLPASGGIGPARLIADPEVPVEDALEQAMEIPGYDGEEFEER